MFTADERKSAVRSVLGCAIDTAMNSFTKQRRQFQHQRSNNCDRAMDMNLNEANSK